jgi:hypothetical protein
MTLTKQKGDIGVAAVLYDLQLNGFTAALPMSDHLPFDLIAISDKGQLKRVSVKYAALDKQGACVVSLRTVYKNNKGNHIKIADKSWYDAVAVFCPDTKLVYYLLPSEIPAGGSRKLRTTNVEDLKSDRKYQMSFAEKFTSVTRIFGV